MELQKAPTRCCEVAVVPDPVVNGSLQQTLPPTSPAFQAMGEFPLVLACCGRKRRAGFQRGAALTPNGYPEGQTRAPRPKDRAPFARWNRYPVE